MTGLYQRKFSHSRKNDVAVAAAYGFEEILDDEAKLVAELFKLYEQHTNT